MIPSLGVRESASPLHAVRPGYLHLPSPLLTPNLVILALIVVFSAVSYRRRRAGQNNNVFNAQAYQQNGYPAQQAPYAPYPPPSGPPSGPGMQYPPTAFHPVGAVLSFFLVCIILLKFLIVPAVRCPPPHLRCIPTMRRLKVRLHPKYECRDECGFATTEFVLHPSYIVYFSNTNYIDDSRIGKVHDRVEVRPKPPP